MSSQKEGYVLTAVDGTIGDFKAYALAGVSFEVTPCAFKKQFYQGVIDIQYTAHKVYNMIYYQHGFNIWAHP